MNTQRVVAGELEKQTSSDKGKTTPPKNERNTLLIPQRLRRRFEQAGIRCFSDVATERRSDDQLVVRGIESGGAVNNAGHYVSFCDEVGQSVPGHLFYEGGIGYNGRHAVVVAPVLIKIEMVREGQMYHLLITRHVPDPSRVGAKRPGSLVETLFYGPEGYLEWDLVRRDLDKRHRVVPRFFTPAGEDLPIPGEWLAAARALTVSVNCSNCRHSHYVSKHPAVSLNP